MSKENYSPEELLFDTLDNLDIGFVKVSNDGTILNHNLTFNKIFGYSLEKNLIGTKTLDYWLNSQERNKFREILFKNGIVKKYITLAKKLDGEKIFLQINIKLNKNSKGEIISSEGTFMDVTKRIKNEQQLSESEMNYKNLLEHLGMLLLIIDRDEIFQVVNEKAAENMGGKPTDFIGKSLNDVFPKDIAENYGKIHQEIYKSGKGITFEHIINLPTGTGTFYTSEQPVKDINGDITAIQIISLDITESTITKHKLEESEKKLKTLNSELEQRIEERTHELNESEIKHKNLSNELKAILDLIPGLVFCKDKNDIVTRVNQNFAEILMLKKEDIIGKTTFDLFPEDQARKFREDDLEVISSGIPKLNIEESADFPSGKTWFITSKVPQFNEEGKSIGVIGLAIDITERKKAEQKLEESGILYRTTVDGLQDPLHVINQNLEIILINDALKQSVKLYGLYTDLIGKTIKEAFPFLHDNVLDEYRSVFNNKSTLLTVETTTLDEKQVTTETRKIPIFDDEENVIQIITIIRDITERKEAEQKLKESKEKYSTLAKLSPVGIFHTDQKGDYLYINERWSQIAGLTLDEALGGSWIGGLHPNDRKRVTAEWYNAVENQVPFESEYRFKRLDGKTSWVYGQAIAIKDDLGKITGYVGTITDISARKLTELKLKESEEKYRLISENANDIISILNDKFEIEHFNESAYQELLGYSKDEVIGNLSLNYIHPDDIERIVRLLKDCFKTGEGQGEVRIKNKIGKYFWFEANGKTFLDNNGEKKIIIVSRNITERKKAEQKLKESEEKYRTLFESSKNGIMFTNMKGIIIDCNQAFLDMLGYTLGELKEISYHQLTPEKWHEMSTDIFNNQFLLKGYTGEFEKEYIRKDGTIIPISINVWLIKDDQGNNKGMWAIVRNITERKKAELKLKESEEKYNNLFQYSNDAILLHDFEGNILEVNDRASDLFKYPKDEILALTTPMLRTSEEQERREALDEEFSKKGFIKFEFNFVKKDGTIFPGEVSSRAIEIKGKKVIQAEIRDISERKMVEQELREIYRLKSEFLRRASHELKTPLISIKGFSDLILSLYADQLDPAITSKLREINDGCERLQNIINNLLKTSRLESTELKPKLQKEDLSFLIKFCVHELESLAKIRKQSIKLDILNDLYANIEKEEIHDVLSNLLTNAIKYTPPMGKIEIITESKKILWLFR